MAAKTLSINYEGTVYTLEFTRRSIENMERQGFNIDEVRTKPLTVLPAFFRGAFLAHHPRLSRDIVDKIYEGLPNKEGLLDKLSEMYAEPIEALFAEPDEGGEKNVTWEANF